MKYTRKDFPDRFLFGVATSSYQIEGHGFGGAGRTHWDDFSDTPGNVVHAENGRRACDHYHRFEEDLDLVKEAEFDAYRFSTSWARVLPDGTGSVNEEGLDFYDRLTDAMLERGIKPMATLYHWELPSALADKGGWRNRDTTKYFGEFAEVIMRRIGDRMHSVATINEPWCVAWLSHFLGHHAPGLRDIRATAHAMHHVLLAHGEAISALRGLGMSNLGAVFNHEWSTPADDSPETAERAELYDAIYNRWFMGGVFKKEYPSSVLAGLEPHMPKDWQDDMDIIGQPVDWAGLNYYTRSVIAPDPDSPWPALKSVEGPLPKTFMDWEIYPEGIYQFLKRAAAEYTGDLPLYVTENGLAAKDHITQNGLVDDPDRTDFINQHLQQVLKACSEGVPIQGYILWSLLDNFEWAFGYEKRFGLVHVDFETLVRTPKQSYYDIQKALKD